SGAFQILVAAASATDSAGPEGAGAGRRHAALDPDRCAVRSRGGQAFVARRIRSAARSGVIMNAKQQISVAVVTVLLVAAIALVSWSYRSRPLGAGTGSGDVT